MRGLVVLLFILLSSFYSYSQVGREFWFAVPEISGSHGDRPIFLRISTGQFPASVTISQPANPQFAPIVVDIQAKGFSSIDLTKHIANLEVKENQITNQGLFVQATNDINVYYEVLGSRNGTVYNSDIFTLKGSHALGTKFFTPFQNQYRNQSTVNGWSSFDIVATENNTTITITPTNPLLGHVVGVPFTIVLQKGQTYSARALHREAAFHLSGSYVQSDKPIAITVKDDSIVVMDAYDLAGDQIVPVDKVGMEYIVINGSINLDRDRIFICATEDSTQLFLNGVDTIFATLNTGQTLNYLLKDSSTYLRCTKPVYVFHLTGFMNEVGGAILPPLKCSGSKKIAFARSNTEPFCLNIILPVEAKDSFLLNGEKLIIPDTSFKFVEGTNGKWLYTQIFSYFDEIKVSQPYLLENTLKDFHLAILNGANTGTGFRYGYFSDFGALDLGPDQTICKGNSISLSAGSNKDSYDWSTHESTSYISVRDSGEYSVIATKGTCVLYDTIVVKYAPEILPPILGEDIAVCEDSIVTLRTEQEFTSYQWLGTIMQPTFQPTESGQYWILVKNEHGCAKTDTVNVIYLPLPHPQIRLLKDEYTTCWDTVITLDAGTGFLQYKWNTNDTSQIYNGLQREDMTYIVEVTSFDGCKNRDTLEVDCSPYIEYFNLVTPNKDNKNEMFFIKNLKPKKWTLNVVNRWGNRVYLNENYDNTWTGEELLDGIYYFNLKHNFGKGNYNGWLHIMR